MSAWHTRSPHVLVWECLELSGTPWNPCGELRMIERLLRQEGRAAESAPRRNVAPVLAQAA